MKIERIEIKTGLVPLLEQLQQAMPPDDWNHKRFPEALSRAQKWHTASFYVRTTVARMADRYLHRKIQLFCKTDYISTPLPMRELAAVDELHDRRKKENIQTIKEKLAIEKALTQDADLSHFYETEMWERSRYKKNIDLEEYSSESSHKMMIQRIRLDPRSVQRRDKHSDSFFDMASKRASALRNGKTLMAKDFFDAEEEKL